MLILMAQATTQGRRHYFHASLRQYSIGEGIGPLPIGERGNFVARHPQGGAEERAEQALEDCRPDDKIGRARCIFLFDSPEQCIVHYDAEYRGAPQNYFIYTVSATERTGHPMALVDHIALLIRTSHDNINHDLVNRMATEYWSPIQRWRFPEFLCESCTVLGCVNRHDVNMDDEAMNIRKYVCQNNYSSDFVTARRMAIG
jgi:hypothetical protein